MAQTLIIKGADFSEHYVEQVTFGDNPCTGITLNKSVTTLETTTSTETLVATPTPVDTTDTIIWATSDPDIVSVENGIISAVGLGTATITATCGNYSASCTVTCGGIVDFKYSIGAFPSSATNDNDYIRLVQTDATNAFGVGLESGTYHATGTETADGWIYPIIIPNGATKISCRCLTQYWGIGSLFFLQSNIESTSKAGAAKYTYVKVTGTNTGWTDKQYDGVACWGNDIDLPTGEYDSCVIHMKQFGSAAVTENDAQKTHIWFE